MSPVDSLFERKLRQLAQHSSRRGWLKGLGGLLVGAAAVPLLPVARGGAQETAGGLPQDAGDPNSCDYWRYCALDGFICGCCGGSPTTCPPGSEMSPLTWVGTCQNPVDGRSYVISYNDCCGKSSCGNCLCQRNEGDIPPYRLDKTNDINWCVGTASNAYHCTAAIVVGIALDQ